MLRVGSFVFKRAETDQELEEIHRLNFRTFVGEIAQHPDPGGERLIDKFHGKNVYFIVLEEGRLIGMVSAHSQPPFSVADRLEDPQILQRDGTRPLEVRLLAVEPDKRHSTVVFGLLCCLYNYAEARGYTHLYLSAFEERLNFYRRLGCEALGPAVRCGQAWFVPMVLPVGALTPKVQRVKKLWESHVERLNTETAPGANQPPERDAWSCAESPVQTEEVCLLPGPVTIAPAVREAFRRPPIYHRGPPFIALFQKVRQALAQLVGSRDVALMNGSGTLANESVAAMLAASGQERPGGVLLVNGEFGQRLARQALRFGLRPRVLTWSWGQPWDLAEIDAALAEQPPGSWVWGVHLESSTGVLNDLPGLVRLARRHGVRVCADCISSLGAVPLDLDGVYLATGASGKSLGSYAGAAIIFADARELGRLDMSRVPTCFDVTASLLSEGPRYTFPSPTLHALEAALADYATPQQARRRFEHYAWLGACVRQELRQLSLEPLAADAWASPVVTTFAPPAEESSQEFVARCRSWGFAIGGQSGYLTEKRLVQIATMGAVRWEDCKRLFGQLAQSLARLPGVLSR